MYIYIIEKGRGRGPLSHGNQGAIAFSRLVEGKGQKSSRPDPR